MFAKKIAVHFKTNAQLLQHLQVQFDQIQAIRNEISSLDSSFLVFKPSAESWSANECLKHLNHYGDFYLPQLNMKVAQLPMEASANEKVFRSGWLGNKFTQMMLPGENGKPTKNMKSPTDKLPIDNLKITETMKIFDDQLEKLAIILQKSSGKRLEKIRIPISISRFITLKAGDVLQFYLAHQLRHLLQAKRAAMAKINR